MPHTHATAAAKQARRRRCRRASLRAPTGTSVWFPTHAHEDIHSQHLPHKQHRRAHGPSSLAYGITPKQESFVTFRQSTLDHVAMRKMLTEAARIGKVGRNVADDARPERAARPKLFPTRTYEQLGTFLDAVDDTEWSALWRGAAWTGMRRGELVALRWDDVDLGGSTITVSRSVGKGIDGPPRQATEIRRRTTHGRARRSARGRSEAPQAVAARATPRDRPRVAGPRSRVLRTRRQPSAPGSALKSVDRPCASLCAPCRPAGDQVPRPTALARHTTSRRGCPPDVVTERLGHRSVAFTLQQYAHRYAGDQRTGLARLRDGAAVALL
jgi:integrase